MLQASIRTRATDAPESTACLACISQLLLSSEADPFRRALACHVGSSALDRNKDVMRVEVLGAYEAISTRPRFQIRHEFTSPFGFATGSTPLGLYKRLIENRQKRGLDY